MAKTEQRLQDPALRGISQCLRSVIAANDGIDIILDDCSDDTTDDIIGEGTIRDLTPQAITCPERHAGQVEQDEIHRCR